MSRPLSGVRALLPTMHRVLSTNGGSYQESDRSRASFRPRARTKSSPRDLVPLRDVLARLSHRASRVGRRQCEAARLRAPRRGVHWRLNSGAKIPEAQCRADSPMPRGEQIAKPTERDIRLLGFFL